MPPLNTVSEMDSQSITQRKAVYTPSDSGRLKYETSGAHQTPEGRSSRVSPSPVQAGFRTESVKLHKRGHLVMIKDATHSEGSHKNEHI